MPMSRASQGIITTLITAAASFGCAWITARGGLISFPNPKLQQQVVDLKQRLESRSKLAGDFEWQWAGDNWLGSVKFENLADGTIKASVDTRAVRPDPQFKSYQDTLEFRSVEQGSANVSDQRVVSLHLPVQVSQEYMKRRHTTQKNVILDAELQPVDAFAGRVKYVGDKTIIGDMILVRYNSDVRKW